jgi:ADP-ribose pyrophosphatase YjhB (NUDIX family)
MSARVHTAGAYVLSGGLHLFVLGAELHQGHIPVYRLGGHRLAHETAWQCAAREVFEEARLQITPLAPPVTYHADGDQADPQLAEIPWEGDAEQEHTPLLVVSACREGETRLSVMYLAQANGLPVPSSEVKGLLLLDEGQIHRLCRQTLTLGQYLDSGGKAILNGDFDRTLALEPFLQLRLLDKMLTAAV